MTTPKDRHGNTLIIGSLVRLLSLSGDWINELPEDERAEVGSMIGEIFEIEEIDEHGRAWIRKAWREETVGAYREHAISLEDKEVELAYPRGE